MDYTNATDQELNIKLAVLLGVHWMMKPNTDQNPTDTWVYGDTGGYHEMVELPDYCNSWADMGPVIYDSGISITQVEEKCAEWIVFLFWSDLEITDKNPLRAAAIVYLMMGDAE